MDFIKIPLLRRPDLGKFILVDGDYDGEYFSQYKWFLNAGGYPVRMPWVNEGRGSSHIYLHREIVKPPPGMVVDHINRDKLDNRSCNLRSITKAQNTYNRSRYGNRRFKGVTYGGTNGRTNMDGTKWTSKRYWAYFRGKFLGSFATEEQAARAWDEAAYEVYGEFGVYNFIEVR